MARPHKVSDEEILVVLKEMRSSHAPATGVDVRRELQRRYGVRAGTDRLYRLLRRPLPTMASSVPASAAVQADVGRERDAALRRAELAELREEATQTRTALEIDSLRQALRSLGVDPFTLEPLGSKRLKV